MTQQPIAYSFADFQRIAAEATAADRFVDARLINRTRTNINALLAKRARQPLLSIAYASDEDGNGISIGGGSTLSGAGGGDFFGDYPVRFNRRTSAYTLSVRAKSSTSSFDVYLYPVWVPSPLANVGMPQDSDQFITITGNSVATFSCTVPPPPWRTYYAPHNQLSYLRIYILSEVTSGAETEITEGVLEAGPDWVRIDDDTAIPNGYVAYVAGDASIEPRVVVNTNVISTTEQLVYVDRPWNKLPEDDDSMVFALPPYVYLKSLCLTPNRIDSTAGFPQL